MLEMRVWKRSTWSCYGSVLFRARLRINAQEAPENNKPRLQFQFYIYLYVASFILRHMPFNLKGSYHAKCTFVRLSYMNMGHWGVRELTKCLKIQPSLFSSIPKSLKTGLKRIWKKQIQILGSPDVRTSTQRLLGGRQHCIAVRKCWRRCST